MSKMLLFSLLLLCTAAFAETASAAENYALPDESAVTVQRVMPEVNFDRIQVDNNPAGDQVCLNIHAFIFKTDDDRVPKLLGETTCMPAGRAKAKMANRELPPKLIPATDGNLF